MKLVFFLLDADIIGGHTRTAASIARALVARGHRVRFVVEEGSRSNLLDSFEVHRVRADRLDGYPGLPPLVEELLRRGEIDVAHTFSMLGLPELLSVCRRNRLPLVRTICGGVAPRPVDVPALPAIVSLSQEVADRLEGYPSMRGQRIAVIPDRIDTAEVTRRIEHGAGERHRRFREKYRVPPSSRVILRVARVHEHYLESILQGAAAAAALRERGHEATFVHIGFVQRHAAHARLVARFEKLNQRFGATVAVTAQDEALDALDHLGMADVVLGSGRTALEAMLAGKPTLVVGRTGFAGLVEEDSVEEIAYFNFSGRNLRTSPPRGESTARLAREIESLLADPARAQQVGEFGRRYVLEKLEAARGAVRYEELYAGLDGSGFGSDGEIRRLRLMRLGRAAGRRVFPFSLRRGIRAWLADPRE